MDDQQGRQPESKPIEQPDSPGGELSSDARTMAMLAHLLGAVIGFLGPLIIWLIKKDEHAFVDDQGKEALNFHLTLLIAYVAVTVIAAVTCGIGGLLFPIVYAVQVIFGIIGTVNANAGNKYRYPVTLRMIN